MQISTYYMLGIDHCVTVKPIAVQTAIPNPIQFVLMQHPIHPITQNVKQSIPCLQLNMTPQQASKHHGLKNNNAPLSDLGNLYAIQA